MVVALGVLAIQSGESYAGEVLKVDANETMVAVSHGNRKWRVKDYLCVLHYGEEVACGPVVKVSPKGAIVQFESHGEGRVSVGDAVAYASVQKKSQRPTTPVRDEELSSTISERKTAPGRSKKVAIAKAAPKASARTTASPPPPSGPEPKTASEENESNGRAASVGAGGLRPDQVETMLSRVAKQRESGDASPVAAVAETSDEEKAPSEREKPSVETLPPAKEVMRSRGPKKSSGGEEVVNLDEVENANVGAPAQSVEVTPLGPEGTKAPARTRPHHTLLGNEPHFKFLFDLWLTHRPGLTPAVTFDTYHSLMILEFYPDPTFYFTFEVSPNPRFYELDYAVTPRLTVRIGKIYIPFDDLTPHSVFGGRINVAKLIHPGGSAFLPEIWADLGVGIRYQLLDRRDLNGDLHLYLVNGFGDGGNDPLGGASAYPEFATTNFMDNNYDKAIGARVHFGLLNDRFGIGLSGYRGRYTSQSKENASLFMVGADLQIRLGETEFRTGYVYMNVSLPEEDVLGETRFLRAGLYGEISQGFGAWKIVMRLGQSQNDHRALAVTDQSVVGGSLLYRPGPVQIALEHSRDLNRVDEKQNYNFTAARVTMAF